LLTLKPYNKMIQESGRKNEWNTGFEWDEIADLCLKEVFKLDQFRENQREIINATMKQKDVLALIPTGGGKSLTFQLSALLEEKITFVIMPLISLIEDNFTFVRGLGIPCTSLTQTGSNKIGKETYSQIRRAEYKLV